MTRATASSTRRFPAIRSAIALTTATALMFSGSAVAGAQTAAAPTPGVTAQETPVLTAEQSSFLTTELGTAAGEIERAQQAAADRVGGTVQPAALPIAAAAVAAAAWCASGALGSVPTSVLDDLTNGGAGTDYARNAIIGCLAGNVGSWAWKVLPGWAKERAVAAVAAFIIKYIR